MEQTHQTAIAEYLELWHKYWLEFSQTWGAHNHYADMAKPFNHANWFMGFDPKQSFHRRGQSRVLQTHLGTAHAVWAAAQGSLGQFMNGEIFSKDAIAVPLREHISDLGAEEFAAQLSSFVTEEALKTYLGVMKYMSHSYERPDPDATTIWRQGSAKLLDYGGDGAATLFVPSLVNKAYVLDLMPQHSLVEFTKQQGLHPYLLDWGQPQKIEQDYGITEYIDQLLMPAIQQLSQIHQQVNFVGYCMGGDLALAAAARLPDIQNIALIATPWDFSKMPVAHGLQQANLSQYPMVPGELIQSFFMNRNSGQLLHKFVDFHDKGPDQQDEELFVALEDWVNDSVDLSVRVAQECLEQWFSDNRPMTGTWEVGTTFVVPSEIKNPTMVIMGERDTLVPPAASQPLAEQLPNACSIQGEFGHTSLVTSTRAKNSLWGNIATWLKN